MSSYREVLVYVEGPSDVEGLKILFDQLIADKARSGVSIEFYPSHGKKNLLNRVLKKSLDIVLHREDVDVVLMPDLYPQNMGFEHETKQELFDGIEKRLRQTLEQKASGDLRVLDRIQTFCFKHDFECLILAASKQLRVHLNTQNLRVSWTDPVEDQNHNHPPKRIVEQIFESCGEKYVATEDAFDILANADYQTLAASCPQSFKPFVDYLEGL